MIKLTDKSRQLIRTWETLELDIKKIIFIILVCLIIAYVDFAFVIKMQFQAIGRIKSEIITLKKDTDTLNKNLTLMQQAQKKELTSTKIKKIISEGEQPKLFQKISDIANKYNVKITELKPTKETKVKEEAKSEVSPLLLTLDLSGGYHNLGSFINDLENLEEVIVVENLKITPQQDSFKQRVNLSLRTYVKKLKVKSKKLNSKLGLLSFALCFWLLSFNFYLLSYAQEEFIYDAKSKRDPFIPLVTSDGRLLKLDQEEGAKGLSLEGIIYDDHGLSYAIVNAEVVKIGDKCGDYQVLKIQKNKVIFIKEGQPTEIELKKEE
jgi:type IV pilus assembly protein PilO